MQLKRLRTFLIDELQEVYISESLVEDALGRMAKAVSSPQLREALQQHREQTKAQLARLETVFSKLEDSPRGGHGISMKALLREGEDRLGTGGDPSVVDAALLTVARRVEHWEIATYSTLKTYAERLTLAAVAEMLGATLAEETAADDRLAELARQMDVTGKEEAA